MTQKNTSYSCENICFGLNRKADEQSLYTFLKLITNEELLHTLIPRLSDQDITECVDFFSKIMHRHLSKEEYHYHLLGEEDSN